MLTQTFKHANDYQIREQLNELNHLISEAFLELGELHSELSQDPDNEYIKTAISMVREINRNQINQARALENTLSLR